MRTYSDEILLLIVKEIWKGVKTMSTKLKNGELNFNISKGIVTLSAPDKNLTLTMPLPKMSDPTN